MPTSVCLPDVLRSIDRLSHWKFFFTTMNSVHKRLILIAKCVRCELLLRDVRKDSPSDRDIQ